MFTTDGWDDAEETRKATKGGDYLRLGDGETVLAVFPTPPFSYRQVWIGGDGGHSEIYDEEKHDGMRPSGRFMFSCFVLTGEKTYEPKAFDASGETFDVLKKAVKKYGPKTVFEVQRHGKKKDTKYTVMYERDLEGGELDHVQSLEPLDAEKMALGSGGDDEEAKDTPEGSDPWG